MYNESKTILGIKEFSSDLALKNIGTQDTNNIRAARGKI